MSLPNAAHGLSQAPLLTVMALGQATGLVQPPDEQPFALTGSFDVVWLM